MFMNIEEWVSNSLKILIWYIFSLSYIIIIIIYMNVLQDTCIDPWTSYDFFEILILKLTTKTFIEVLLDKEEQKFNYRYKNIINSVADLMSFCMG